MNAPLGKIDCRGITRSHPNADGNTDQFVVAEVRSSLYLRESSLSIDDASRVVGGVHGLLLLVADGVGGNRQSGERASTVALEAITHYLVNSFDVRHELNPIREQQLLDDLRQSLLDCRDQMKREVAAAERFSSMDTTLTMAYVVWPRAYVIHVGNNRAYHMSDVGLKCLTSDHTVAKRLQQGGVVNDNQAAESDMRKVLSNVLGTSGAKCEPDRMAIDLSVGDALILCSDGVFRTISEEEMSTSIMESQTATEACERILSGGGEQQDDATVVVAKFLRRKEIVDTAGRQAATIPDSETKADTSKVRKLKTKPMLG